MRKLLLLLATVTFAFASTINVPGNYPTIQAAIDAVTTVDGDIIQIDAGTYTEALTVGKSLTFIGSGPTSNPTTIITSTASRVIKLTVTGKSFTFQNLIVEGIDTNLGIYAHGSIDINSLTMQDVIARNCKVALYLAEYWPSGGPFTTTVNNLSMDNVTLTNNKFIGAYIGKTVLTGTVTNCTITDNGYSDELPNDWQKTGLQFVNFDEASVPHVVVTNSTFSNNGAGASNIERTGLIIYTAYNGLSASEIMTVSGCSFSNHPLYAVRIKNGYNVGNTATVNGTFSSNYLDIWFNNIIGTTSSTTLVRNTFDGIKSVGASPTYDYYTIQAAIDAADAEDVITVDAGTYDENIIVNKSLTLNGANADVTCGSRVSESIIAPGSGLPISVTANGVTINGFEITAPGYPNAIVCGNTSNLDIIFNNIHDIYGGTSSGSNAHGINYTVASSPAATVNVNISDNCFTDIGNFNNHKKSAKAIGVIQRSSTGTLTNLTIERNNISNVFAKKAGWSSGGRIAYGIQLAVGSSNYLTTTGNVFNAQINDNDISNLEGFISTGIALEGNTENAVVKNNNISTLTGYKLATRDGGGYDLQGLKFEENRYVATCTVENNNFNADTYVYNGTFGLGYAIANYVPVGLPYTGGTTGKAVTSCNWHGTAVASDITDNATLTGKIFNKDNCETDFIPFWTAIDGSCIGGTLFGDKYGVRDDLTALLPSVDKKTYKILEKAIGHLEKSLADELWKDNDHLSSKGIKVFEEEKIAVHELMKIGVPDVSASILELVRIDGELAQTVIDEVVDEKDKAKAIEEMTKALDEFNKGNFDKAIEHYKQAWHQATKALKNLSKSFANSNVEEGGELVDSAIPEVFGLGENYPNPFNPTTLISYDLPEASQVSMTVYDMMGRQVKSLVQEFQPAGNHSVIWNATNDNGAKMSGGMYFYQIRAGSFQKTHKMILLK